jgi:hypothetical protein
MSCPLCNIDGNCIAKCGESQLGYRYDPDALLIKSLDSLVKVLGGNMHHLTAINKAIDQIAARKEEGK